MRRSGSTGMWAACWLALAFTGCARPAPEQALRDRMQILQRDVDARDSAAVASVLADDFAGNDGMDRQGARRLAAAVFLRYRDVGVRIGPLEIRLQGDTRASVEFTAAVSGSGGGLLPERGQIYRVRTGWRLDDGEWRMTSALWDDEL